MTTQYGFFIDSSRCTGCKTCELACKDYKDLTPERLCLLPVDRL